MFMPYMGKNYVLDKLGSDAVNSLVLGMSYVRLTKKYRGPCLRVMRASDFASIWVEFSAGYIAIAQIAAFCAGTEGRCPEHCNQSILAGANNAVQATWANMPIVFAGGVFNADGLNFVSASSNYMSVADYAGIQIINPFLSWYCNYYPTSTSTGYIFSRMGVDFSENQYSLQSINTVNTTYLDANGLFALASVQSINSINKHLFSWTGKNPNETKAITNSNNSQSTANITLTNRNNFTIGARPGFGAFYAGNIKTIAVFNSNRYPDYNTFVNGGM